MSSGLYIVTLNNIDPIHVNAQDSRDNGRSITVTKDNCKFGKAKDFEKRKRNYFKTFGELNVNFTPVVTLDNIDEIERVILKELNEYRITGRSGRKNEWLEGISPAKLSQIIFSTLERNGIVYTKILKVT